ncbi:MAG TPA: gluconokinase [Candidatus Tectomicrobia bacterium]|jgi:gluconokinase
MIILLMGVAGSGKTTVGRLLARALGWRFYEGDDFHPPANVDKMQRGMPLTDDDRWPWLQALKEVIAACLAQGTSAVMACSALKQTYRDYLINCRDEVKPVYLKGSYDLLSQRLAQRQGHFMPRELLASQFATLEEPRQGLIVDVDNAPETLVAVIRQALRV